MIRVILILAVAIVCAVPTTAQMSQGRDHITFEKIKPITAGAGDTVKVLLKGRIHKHWHTYGLTPSIGPDGMGPQASEISVGPKSLIRLAGKPKILKGAHVYYDTTWSAKVEDWIGSIEVEIPIVLSQQTKIGSHPASITFSAQMCDTTSCLPPDDMVQKISFTVDKEYSGVLNAEQNGSSSEQRVASSESSDEQLVSSSEQRVASGEQKTESDEVTREKSKGLLSFFFYAMGVGFLALLTPCVFPMIPITVSFFTKRHEKKKSSGISDSAMFGLGIISTFTAVGLVVSVIFGGTAVSDWAANPWMNLAIAGLFLILAFNLFGAFEIQVPVSIMNKLNKKSQGNSVAAVWLMGLTFSLTSFTCTVPFVGTLLLSASAASSAEGYIYPAVGTLGFATAFALPFVVLSMFPALLVRLPRAGGWMNNIKVVMGFLEIAAAIKFISNADLAQGWGILPREVFLSVWAGVCLLIVLYTLGVFEMKLDSKIDKVGAIRVSFAIVFASLTVWFGAGLLGAKLHSFVEALLPPDNYEELIYGSQAEGSGAGGRSRSSIGAVDVNGNALEKLKWLNNLDEAKAIAKESGKPIFIDFTGFTCTNCRLMEKYVFSKPMIEEKFKDFVLVQLFTDRKTEPYISNQNILKSYGTIANPLYVMLKPDGTFIAQSGYLPKYQSDPSTFAQFLDTAL